MVACKPHTHLLRGFGGSRGQPGAPLVVQRTDQEFIPAILAELGSAEGRQKLPGFRAREHDASGTLRLFQPVHRTFHVVLVEALCEEVGFPRVDPTRIESAGLVVRRAVPSPGAAGVQGWMRQGDAIAGWKTLGPAELKRDPDPERRRPEARAGHPEIDRRLAPRLADDGLAETVHPLFVAPPEVCRKAGRTVLYALVPLTSTEKSEGPLERPPYPAEEVAKLVPPFLRESSRLANGTRTAHVWQPKQEELPETRGWVESLDGLGVFDDTPEAKVLVKTLDAIAAQYYDPAQPAKVLATRPLGGELRSAAERLTDTARAERAPAGRPMRFVVDDKQAAAISKGLRNLLTARLAAIVPGESRFDLAGARYQVQAFVRLSRPCGCPPELVWTPPTDPFTIVPWFESGAAPPVRVNLPEATPAALKKLKPNVTFVTPASVADLLQGLKLKDLADGKKPGGGGLGLDLVCGFSIPIITLCAFIVLSIFLSLLNIIFWWLPLVKICIPLPKKLSGSGG